MNELSQESIEKFLIDKIQTCVLCKKKYIKSQKCECSVKLKNVYRKWDFEQNALLIECIEKRRLLGVV